MRLKCEGWHRNRGERELYRSSLSEAAVASSSGTIPYERPRIRISDRPPNRPNGGWAEILFRVDTRETPLNGEYLFSLKLSRDDLRKLFLAANRDMPVGALIGALAELSESIEDSEAA